MTTPVILLLALILDAIFGEPKWLWSRIPHPAVIMGNLINRFDRVLNVGRNRKLKGILVMVFLWAMAALAAISIEKIPDYGIVEILVVAVLVAQKSLADHVGDVADALHHSVENGRVSVAKIVGRDTNTMDESAIARSAIESAAENLSDGVVAPVFWFLLLGLPGLLIYKMTNTADSMIGYLNDKYRDFGWAAARLDDVLNWIPARLTSFLIALSGGAYDASNVIFRDAPLHRSPNAGWPEAAMAKTLDVALSGPRSYDGIMRDFPFVYAEGRRNLNAKDIIAATSVLWRVWAVLVGVSVILALIP